MKIFLYLIFFLIIFILWCILRISSMQSRLEEIERDTIKNKDGI